MDFTKLRACELFLFDMDGTLYLGDEIFDGAVELMEDLPALGKKYIYLTNNSSRAGTDYITRLKGFGFPCEAENVFTSGMATGMYLNQNYPGAKVYLVGTQAFRRELLSYGIHLVGIRKAQQGVPLSPARCNVHRGKSRLGMPDAAR